MSDYPTAASEPSQQQARDVLALHGKSFYWASKFLGSTLASRAERLYMFCRYVDDLADGDLPDREQSLKTLRRRLVGERVAVGQQAESFISFAQDNDIPLTAAVELLDGMIGDQQPRAVATEAELLRYCHAVAGTVGVMMCRLLNCQEPRAVSFAIDLGIAMQLTNISRDVLEDARMDRRYLPAEWVNLPASAIAGAEPCTHAFVAAAIEKTLTLAEQYYASALVGIQLLPFRSRLAIVIALRVYRQIGWLLRRRRLAWWRGRVVVGRAEKLMVSLRGVIDLMPKTVPPHQAQLHRPLNGLTGVQ